MIDDGDLFDETTNLIGPDFNLPIEEKMAKVKKIHDIDHMSSKILELRARCSGDEWDDVSEVCNVISKNCQSCNEINIGKTKFNHLSSHKRGYPLDSIHMDIAGPFTDIGVNGENVILVAVDAFTSFVWLKPLSNPSSRDIITSLKEIFYVVGFPIEIFSDNASIFVSREFNEFCSENNITHLTSPEYCPRSNGLAERKGV